MKKNKKDGRKNNGGARRGSGPKKTGKNCKTLSISIHKDIYEPLKKFLLEKRDELKAEQLLNSTEVFSKKNLIKKLPFAVAGETKLKNSKKGVSATVTIKKENYNPGSDYLEKRRKSKLGLK